MGRHHHQGSFGEQTPDFFQFSLYNQFFREEPAFLATNAPKSALPRLQQSIKKQSQKTTGEAKSTDAKGTHNLLRIAVNDGLQDFSVVLFGFGIGLVQGVFDQFSADATPELALFRRINFPALFLDADAFLVDGFGDQIGHLLCRFTGEPILGKGINFLNESAPVFTQCIDGPFFNIGNDRREYGRFCSLFHA